MKNYVLVFVVALFFKASVAEETKLNVGVYFESLCPDSYKFIKDQLQPNFKDIAQYVNLKLVPFGKSSSGENATEFTCHHGPAECKGNKILSCAINKLPDQKAQVEFTACFMTTYRVERKNEEEHGQKCAQAVALDAKSLAECYNSEEGKLQQLTAEKDTTNVLNAPLKSVPTIVFNEKFDQKLHEESLEKFKSVACSLIQKSNPKACEEPSPVVPL